MLSLQSHLSAAAIGLGTILMSRSQRVEVATRISEVDCGESGALIGLTVRFRVGVH
jgi:hypothetical protein